MKEKLKSFFQKKKKAKILMIVSISFLLFMISYRIKNYIVLKNSVPKNERQLRTVSIMKLQKENLDLKLSFLGKIYPKSEFFITPDIQGAAIVHDILFREGDKIQKNQILMNLDQTFVKNEFFNLYKVRSQNHGIISNVYVEVGEKVTPGKPLFKIVDISQIKVIIDISERYLNKVKKGQKIIVEIKNQFQEKINENSTFIGKIDYLNPVSSFEKGKNIQAIAFLDNTDLRIKSGFFADVEIFIGKNDLFLIPMSSIIFESNSYSVYTYDPQKKQVFLREIKIGNILYNKFVEIKEGLKENEFFLIRGQSFVFDGETVILDNDIQQ